MAYKVKFKRKQKVKKEQTKQEIVFLEPKTRPFHPYDESILRTLNQSKIDLTPTEISKINHIHSVTARTRIKRLEEAGFVLCRGFGNRKYYRINKEKFKQEQLT